MIEIRDGDLGKAVHATELIEEGRCILRGWGSRISHRSRHSMQVDHDRHVVIPGPIELINHSCDPNCGVLVRPEAESLEIYALRPIAEGEELFTDYASFEYEILHMPGRCLCGTSICRGKITGYKDLPESRKAALGRYIAGYLREMDVLVEQTA
jgi:hypothetical protein